MACRLLTCIIGIMLVKVGSNPACDLCPPGTFFKQCASDGPNCGPCEEGVTYTDDFNYWNVCKTCKKYCFSQRNVDRSKECTITHDLLCTCEKGYHAPDNMSQCYKHTPCPPGTRLKSQGTATTNNMCEVCPPGTYSDKPNSELCQAWTNCSSRTAGCDVKVPGNRTRDNLCGITDPLGGFNETECVNNSHEVPGTVVDNKWFWVSVVLILVVIVLAILLIVTLYQLQHLRQRNTTELVEGIGEIEMKGCSNNNQMTPLLDKTSQSNGEVGNATSDGMSESEDKVNGYAQSMPDRATSNQGVILKICAVLKDLLGMNYDNFLMNLKPKGVSYATIQKTFKKEGQDIDNTVKACLFEWSSKHPQDDILQACIDSAKTSKLQDIKEHLETLKEQWSSETR